jgi:hypothetical protein
LPTYVTSLWRKSMQEREENSQILLVPHHRNSSLAGSEWSLNLVRSVGSVLRSDTLGAMSVRTPERLFYVRKTTCGAKKQRERAIQKALMGTLRREFPFVVDFFNDWAAGAYLTHGQSQQRQALSSGKGWSDLFIPYPSRGYHGMFLEIKRENERIYTKKRELIADDQVRIEAAFLDRMNKLGYFARFGVGMENCERLIRWYLNP